MRTTDTIVIGGGQAGLAASHCLADRGHDHVVLERGVIGQRWHTETWDSLHLLTPNWMNTLPAWPYGGPEPDGFMSAVSFADHLARYARSFDAPVDQRLGGRAAAPPGRPASKSSPNTVSGSARTSSSQPAGATGRGPGDARCLAADMAPGRARAIPQPGLAAGRRRARRRGLGNRGPARRRARVPPDATSPSPSGSHSRMPRRYRGMDIFWWLDRIGVLDKTIDEMPAPERGSDRTVAPARRPSRPALARPDVVAGAGVALVGRLSAVAATEPGSRPISWRPWSRPTPGWPARWPRSTATSTPRTARPRCSRPDVIRPSHRSPSSTRARPPRAGIRTVIWATGHRRLYPVAAVPRARSHGELRQRRGVTPVPGLYVLGQRFQHHRRSNFIGGVGRDAAFVADHIAGAQHAVASDMSAVSGN